MAAPGRSGLDGDRRHGLRGLPTPHAILIIRVLKLRAVGPCREISRSNSSIVNDQGPTKKR